MPDPIWEQELESDSDLKKYALFRGDAEGRVKLVVYKEGDVPRIVWRGTLDELADIFTRAKRRGT